MTKGEIPRSKAPAPPRAANIVASATGLIGATPADASKLASLDASPTEVGGAVGRANPVPAEESTTEPRRRRRADVLGKAGAALAAAEPAETTTATQERRREPVDGDLIRRRWRSLIGRHPPKTVSYALMDRILAWRGQVVETGDINSRSRAILAAALAGGGNESEKSGGFFGRGIKNALEDRPARPGAMLRTGTVLVREHAGVLHRVTVVPEGFEWEGKVYASLSAVARAITGVRWNGHRFFALDRTPKNAGASRAKKLAAGANTASLEPNEALGSGDAT